jgi:hypothetical protein
MIGAAKPPAPPWSPAELEVLFASAGDWEQSGQHPWDRIASLLPGRSVAACKYQYFKGQRGQRPRHTGGAVLATSRQRAEAAETARRIRAEHERQPRSLTAILCGDPLPGCSALDQRREATPAITLPTMLQVSARRHDSAERDVR